MSEMPEEIAFTNPNENDKYKVLQELLKNDDNITVKTELNDTQIRALVVLRVQKHVLQNNFGYNSAIIQSLEKSLCELNISKNRKSRKEIVDVLKAETTEETSVSKRLKNMLSL